MKQVDAPSQLQWLALSLSPNIGAATFNNLLAYFDQDLDAVLAAPSNELMRVRGVGAKIAGEIGAIDLDRLAQELEAWRAQGIEILLRGGEHYPQPLNETSDLPLALFTSRIMRWRDLVECRGHRRHARAIQRSALYHLAVGDAAGARRSRRHQRIGARHRHRRARRRPFGRWRHRGCARQRHRQHLSGSESPSGAAHSREGRAAERNASALERQRPAAGIAQPHYQRLEPSGDRSRVGCRWRRDVHRAFRRRTGSPGLHLRLASERQSALDRRWRACVVAAR